MDFFTKVDLIDLALNGIDSHEQAGSTSGQPTQKEGAASIRVRRQRASRSNVEQVANKKVAKGPDASGSKQQHKCPSCEYTVSSVSELIIHTRKHFSKKLFNCTVSTRGFTQKGSLTTNMKIHAKKLPLRSIYEQEFDQRDCNGRQYECYLCDFATFEESSLFRHMRRHTDIKPTCKK